MAFALVLLTGAPLFISGMGKFIHQDPGWRIDGLLSGGLPLTAEKYATPDQRRAFFERLEPRLAALPGVEGAAISSSLPLWALGASRPFLIEGRPPPALGQEPLVHVEVVTSGYFATMDIRLREGRCFAATDTTNRPDVVIVNETMARHFWPGESAIGKRVGSTDRENPRWQEIVGVVNDLRFPGNFVAERTGEIGIPAALGARRLDVMWFVFRKGLFLSFLGIVLGFGGAFLIARLLAAAVPELPAHDPLAFTGVSFALLMVALCACWLPARRAAKVDPMEALRQE